MTIIRRHFCSRLILRATLALPLVAVQGFAQLNENCTVAILNRTAQVKPDGSWRVDNIPANFGPVRARATCVQNGVTSSGQSNLFTIVANAVTGFNADIVLGPVTPIPAQLTLTANPTTLSQAGQTVQVNVTGTYASGPPVNLSNASTGTQYQISNPALATISANGLVTALKSGTVLVQANNEGTQGLLQLSIALSRDSDGDGILDDVELANGLDPNNPADALDDRDHDGLNNRDELTRGTDINNPDTDGDGLSDGAEVHTHHTNPLLKDTDGDGVPDNVEIATGSDPNNPASINLGQALKRITVEPASFIINVNSVQGLAFQQLTVTGEFNLGGTIDLTARARGTNYTSSNLQVCNFGAEDGRVFAGIDGSCTITITNSGFTTTSSGVVRGFTPTALGFVAIGGFANAVAVNGNFAYIAAGGAGLQVVNIANKNAPVVVGSLDTPGNANGVDVVGNFAYIADDSAGLQIINIANPTAPTLVGSIATGGQAKDVVVRAGVAYIANGAAGLRIVNVSTANSPSLLGAVDTPGEGKGVAVDTARKLAVLADGTGGLRIINVAVLSSPAIIGSITQGLGDARDVALSGNTAIVADNSTSMTAIDLTVPTSPVFRSSTPINTGGRLNDVVVAGTFGIGADVVFVNGVPIVDISNPSFLSPRAILNLAGDFDGQGIAADGIFLYLTAVSGSAFIENGTTGVSRLFIGQYLAQEDKAGIAPTVTITSPTSGSSIVAGKTIAVAANATDDIQVAAVNLLVNGQAFATDTSFPFEFAVPTSSQGTITLQAQAIDLGGNTGTSAAVTVSVIPDPLTTVTGRVVDRNSAPVSGAAVSVLGRNSTSVTNGTFSFAGVPTAPGDIVVTASAVIAGKTLRGRSTATPPVLAGTTNVGDVRLSSGKIGLLHCDTAVQARAALVASGQILDEDITELPRCTTPTLASLADFGALFVWSNTSFSDPDGLGNVLADYVDQGGGLVMATYAFSQSWRVGGRIMTPGYSPFTVGQPAFPPGSLNLASSNTAHPIMQGVPAGPYFTNGNYSTVPLALNAQVIAVDTGGNRVVAVNQSGRIVGVSIFPGFGDMGRLFANALNFVR